MGNFSYHFISADDYIQGLREESEKSDEARYLLACALMDGVLVEKDRRSNREVADLLTYNGFSWAKLKLADMICEGDLDRDWTCSEFDSVFSLLKGATKENDCPPAWVKLGWMWALGLGGKHQNLEEAKRCLTLYEKSDTDSMKLQSFIERIENDQHKVTSDLKNRDSNGRVPLQPIIDYLLDELKLMPSNDVEGSSNEPADADDIAFELRLGKLYYYGFYRTDPDDHFWQYGQAKEHFEKAAKKNDEALRYLASMYYRQLIDGKNDAKAIELYECAAETNPRAQYELGVLLGQKGNEKGWSEAFQLLEKVAFHESDVQSDAQCLLGDVYRFGLLNCEFDIDKAVELYEMSSEQGNIVARLRLEELGSRI